MSSPAKRLASIEAIEAALTSISNAVRALRLNTAREHPQIFERSVERHNALPPIVPTLQPTMVAEAISPPPIFVIYDFETSGIGKTKNIRIRQIGARAVSGSTLESIGTFTTFVDPDISTTDGYETARDEYVSGLEGWNVTGRKFSNWLQQMRNHDEDCPLHLIAHNGKRFDARILAFENARHKVDFNSYEVYSCDSIDVFKTVYPGLESYNLGSLYQDVIGHELKDAHDAMADVDGVWKLMRYNSEESIVNILKNSEQFRHVQKRCFKS